ncbi:ArsR family transcriptional regulator [Sphingomonas jejuensis]|uniref:ArsR family transcriptional regulator n=1 Tax=Sphingomonas jejuensis TaxID=904715 RepID=A0ABX0XGT7_9SPHN|nr:ArsR family transcriptional regulator [Sphingomonas jejuensis]
MTQLLDMFRALADPTRIRLVALLRRMELSVGELAQILGQSQPRVSRHVRILCDAGLAERRKEGSWVFLKLAGDETSAPLIMAVGSADADVLVLDRERLDAVVSERAAAADRYFEAHAEEWDAIRSLHVADSEVEAAIAGALGEDGLGRLVDLGTGTGRMLELFGGRAVHAIGIDRSPEMLRLARAKLAAADLPPTELRQGDLQALPLTGGSADTVILHQVLHFMQQPGAAVSEAARLLATGGRMLIVDFDSHDREDLRDRDQHVRLGFSDDQIAVWMQAAGLTLDRVERLEGGELTVKLWSASRPGGIKEKAA